MYLLSIVLYLAIPLSCSLVEAVSPPIVDLGYATYQGVFNSTSNTTNFLGIRYAAPPVGDNLIYLHESTFGKDASKGNCGFKHQLLH